VVYLVPYRSADGWLKRVSVSLLCGMGKDCSNRNDGVQMKAQADANSDTFGSKLKYLLENEAEPESGKMMGIPQLAARMVELGFKVHANTLRGLLNGTKNNPTWQVVEGIARAYGVPTDLFRTDVTVEQWKLRRLQRHLLSPADKRLGVVPSQGSSAPEGLDLATDVATHILQYFAAHDEASSGRSSTGSRRRTARSAWSDTAGNANLEEDDVQRAVAP
jgi:transcriptional regulator with XRE-family HTH domain